MNANAQILNFLPMSASEMQRRRGIPRPTFIGDLAKQSSGDIRPEKSIQAVPRSAPTANILDAPYKGWDMTGLDTFQIPRYDQQQLSLFSRYILRDPNAESHSDVVRRATENILQKHPQFKQPPTNIKQQYRNTLGGKTNMAPKALGG